MVCVFCNSRTECHTGRCQYNEVNFLQNRNNRQPIARPRGWYKGRLLWVQITTLDYTLLNLTVTKAVPKYSVAELWLLFFLSYWYKPEYMHDWHIVPLIIFIFYPYKWCEVININHIFILLMLLSRIRTIPYMYIRCTEINCFNMFNSHSLTTCI